MILSDGCPCKKDVRIQTHRTEERPRGDPERGKPSTSQEKTRKEPTLLLPQHGLLEAGWSVGAAESPAGSCTPCHPTKPTMLCKLGLISWPYLFSSPDLPVSSEGGLAGWPDLHGVPSPWPPLVTQPYWHFLYGLRPPVTVSVASSPGPVPCVCLEPFPGAPFLPSLLCPVRCSHVPCAPLCFLPFFCSLDLPHALLRPSPGDRRVRRIQTLPSRTAGEKTPPRSSWP